MTGHRTVLERCKGLGRDLGVWLWGRLLVRMCWHAHGARGQCKKRMGGGGGNGKAAK